MSKIAEMLQTSPIQVEKSIRGDEVRALTSCRAGKIVPVYYAPLLREDRVTKGNIRLKLDMAETIHPLMNSVNVTAYVHFVPFLAFERFTGMESFNRSYQGQGEPHNNVPIPFFTTMPFDREAAIWKTLGVHFPQGSPINSAPVEAYNTLINFRRKLRSDRLPERLIHDTTLAAAFWKNPNVYTIVPDFDQAMIDGEVELQFNTNRLPVNGIGRIAGTPTLQNNVAVFEASGAKTYQHAVGTNNANYRFDVAASGTPLIFAELAEAGVRLSLSNIELAKKTVAFAKMREKFSALDDDHIIDLLMEGIRVPDEALKQPILLSKQSTIFGYSERHAMDGASLEMSVTTGETSLDLSFRTPPMNTGGIIMVTLEIVPEQLWERMTDTFLGISTPSVLPNFLRDYLDPEKVEVVGNGYLDRLHSNAAGTFGYAPLNYAWKRSLARIGGKYYRRYPDTFVEDRQRFWSIEQVDPRLSTDFYIVPETLPHSVFMDTISDPFEVLTLGNLQIVGNTVFGKELTEDNGDYDAIMDQVDTSRITQVPVA